MRTLPRLDRGSAHPQSLLAGPRLALRERPSLVITSGAGLAVPFTLTAKALGARVVFIETMARVETGSLSGRTIAKVGARVIVQWPELRRTYPRATVCRPALLEGLNSEVGRTGGGTFVTVGSHDVPFDRLLDAVQTGISAGILPEPVTVQSGASVRRVVGATTVPFMSPREFNTAVEEATVVVTHGGAGAMATALRFGKRPIVMARTAKLREHVDNHQDELVRKLDRLGLVVRVGDRLTRDAVARSAIVLDCDSRVFGEQPTVQEVLVRALTDSGHPL